MKNLFAEATLYFGLDDSFQYSEEQQGRYVRDYLKSIGQDYRPSSKKHKNAITAAPEAARHAKRKAWEPAGVILAKPQAVTRHFGTRY